MTIQQSAFKFNLGQQVQITLSSEQGAVRARGDGVDRQNQYFIAYKNALGVATESWWNEDLLTPVN